MIHLSINFPNSEICHISLTHFDPDLSQSYCLKHYVVEGNTETATQKCFIKAAVLKNVWKIPKKTPVRRIFFRVRG